MIDDFPRAMEFRQINDSTQLSENILKTQVASFSNERYRKDSNKTRKYLFPYGCETY